MKKFISIVILFLLSGTILADCPDIAVLKKEVRNRKDITEACICNLLAEDHSNSTTIPIIKAYSRNHRITDTLLLCTWRLSEKKEMQSVLATVVKAWKQNNPSLSAILRDLQKYGASRRMDSLCTILNTYSKLSSVELLQWVDIKVVLNDLDPVPEMLCRIIEERSQLTTIALNQLSKVLTDLSAKQCATLLHEFSDCSSRHNKKFQSEILPWLVSQLGTKHLFKQQLELIYSSEKNPGKRNNNILEVSRSRFSQKQYLAAAGAATMVYRISNTDSTRQHAAVLCYYSYRRLNQPDSALTWFERIRKKADNEIVEAVALYQITGNYDKAAKLLDKLPPSLSRDTLYLRQLLFSNALDKADSFLSEKNTLLRRHKAIYALWQIRTSLFKGDYATCKAVMDSLPDIPKTTGASEILEYRYWFLRLDNRPEALAKFSQIEYTLFKGKPKKAASLLCDATNVSEISGKIALRIARELLRNEETAEALQVLACAPLKMDPAYIYTMAEACHQNGDDVKAQKLLKKLLLDFPVSIHTSRGRVLLTQLEKLHSGN